MFDASIQNLKTLASLVWYSGAVVLSVKSFILLLEAYRINPDQPWVWLAIVGGLLIGAIKAKYLFIRLCLKNLERIEGLSNPKLWHFYRMHFFIFLFCMILLGSFVSRLAHGDYPMLITMAIIELSVGTALLGSCHCFWKKQ
jgi:hypothetical protein